MGILLSIKKMVFWRQDDEKMKPLPPWWESCCSLPTLNASFSLRYQQCGESWCAFDKITVDGVVWFKNVTLVVKRWIFRCSSLAPIKSTYVEMLNLIFVAGGNNCVLWKKKKDGERKRPWIKENWQEKRETHNHSPPSSRHYHQLRIKTFYWYIPTQKMVLFGESQWTHTNYGVRLDQKGHLPGQKSTVCWYVCHIGLWFIRDLGSSE